MVVGNIDSSQNAGGKTLVGNSLVVGNLYRASDFPPHELVGNLASGSRGVVLRVFWAIVGGRVDKVRMEGHISGMSTLARRDSKMEGAACVGSTGDSAK